MTDTEAFEAFILAYQHMVYSTAARLLGNDADAADIAQEVFLKAFDRFDMLKDNPSAGGWLKTVATNLCLNHLTRYRARWRFFSDMMPENATTNFEDLLAAEPPSPDADERAHRRHYLEQALRRLPAPQRVPVVLYHFEDMSYAEIARRLGVSLSKVKTDIHRGRESLRRWLNPDPDQWDQKPIDDAATGHSPDWRQSILQLTQWDNPWRT